MKKIACTILFALILINFNAQIFKAKDGGTLITFYSKSPLEDIDATNKGGIIILNTSSSAIQVKLTIQNFIFKNKLMGEHFNENYLETDKTAKDSIGKTIYPNQYATFKGKINEKVDYSKDGETKVTVTGKMTLHGVTKDETYNGTLKKVGNEIIIDCKFKIKVADYDVKVPSLYVKNIAEIVDIDVKSTLEPFVKKPN